MNRIINLLHSSGASIVVAHDDAVISNTLRGVAGIWAVFTDHPEILRGGDVADKVIGKGAAAVMAAGGARRVYADIMSRHALDILRAAGVETSCATLVDNIINRAGTGPCPVEALTASCPTAMDCIPPIRKFLNQLSKPSL